MRKFQFIGNRSPCKPSERFTLEVKEEEFEMMKKGETNCFSGVVIESGSKAPHGIGYQSNKFVNPYVEMKQWGWPVFVLIRD